MESRLRVNGAFLLGVFLKFCLKLSWAGECGGVMEGIMLGGENNMLRPTPGGKFVPSYDKNRDMARWA